MKDILSETNVNSGVKEIHSPKNEVWKLFNTYKNQRLNT